MTTFAPRTTDEVAETLRWALSGGEALEIVAAGSRRPLGRPVSSAHVLDVSGLSGIVSHEPSELVLTALAGTPMHVIDAALAASSQCLAFEPPDFASLLGTQARGTFGGAIVTGLSGPRRFKAGAARDHVLGVAAVSGRGEAFVGGGKVVKNVTGYDMPKLMAGSFGTLAVLTEITVKVLPAAEDSSSVLVSGLTTRDAVRTMTRVLQSPADVSGACHLPAGVSMPHRMGDGAVTAFRLEGFAPSVRFRRARLCDELAGLGALTVVDAEESQAFWRAVRDVAPFQPPSTRLVWRISVPAAQGADVFERLEHAVPGAQMFLDWGGGLIWLATHAHTPADAVRIRQAVGEGSGHATLIRAPADVRAETPVFQPQAPALAALTGRVKKQFDPARTLNPGRMYADF